MAEDFTPDTEQVRSHYVFDQTNQWSRERGERFDRWLADHDRKLRNETLEEAAQVADDGPPLFTATFSRDGRTIAAAIRAMKATTPTEPHVVREGGDRG